MKKLTDAVSRGERWEEAVKARYEKENNWLHNIVTSRSRVAFFDQVLPKGNGPVLDVGSGWGQIARPLARQRPVIALEPVAERLDFIQAAAAQDGIHNNMVFIQADYLETDFKTKFDAICAIGVLEWAGAFQNQVEPQQRQAAFLRKARRELSQGGALIVGIENRLGLKYLLGSPDDHIGVPGIACLTAALARRRWQATSGHTMQSFTYSLSELSGLLRAAGFSELSFWGAFPDYKLPARIVSLANNGDELNAWLLNEIIPHEHNGYNGAPVSPQAQEDLISHYRSLAAEGIAQHFVPSFFVRAR